VLVDVEPSVGIGPVRLDMTQADVLAAMGTPEHRFPNWSKVGERWSWHRSCFQVFFGASGQAGEIMLCFGGPVEAVFAGIDLFRTPAEEVVARLSLLEEGRPAEDGCSYEFPGLHLAFWRQVRPGGAPDDDPQYRGGRFWDTVSTWTDFHRLEIGTAADDARGGPRRRS
jgi:hypothetical protein